MNAKITAHTDCGCAQLIDKVFQVTPVISRVFKNIKELSTCSLKYMSTELLHKLPKNP